MIEYEELDTGSDVIYRNAANARVNRYMKYLVQALEADLWTCPHCENTHRRNNFFTKSMLMDLALELFAKDTGTRGVSQAPCAVAFNELVDQGIIVQADERARYRRAR